MHVRYDVGFPADVYRDQFKILNSCPWRKSMGVTGHTSDDKPFLGHKLLFLHAPVASRLCKTERLMALLAIGSLPLVGKAI